MKKHLAIFLSLSIFSTTLTHASDSTITENISKETIISEEVEINLEDLNEYYNESTGIYEIPTSELKSQTKSRAVSREVITLLEKGSLYDTSGRVIYSFKLNHKYPYYKIKVQNTNGYTQKVRIKNGNGMDVRKKSTGTFTGSYYDQSLPHDPITVSIIKNGPGSLAGYINIQVSNVPF